MSLPTGIALNRESIATPSGIMLFTVSCKVGKQADDEASGFVAIAHHPDTGVMAIGSSGYEKGAAGYRLACANAASELCMSVQAITKYKRMFEATRYAQ